MKVTKNITIDLNNPRRHVVHLMESGNQREIALTLLKDGMPFDVSDGIGTATLVKGVGYIKANGVPGYYDWTSTDLVAVEAVTGSTNKWTVRLDEHATDVPGFAQIFVKFSLASGETLYSFPITLDVIRTSGGTTDPDRPYYHSTSFLLAGAQAEKTTAMSFPVGVDGDGKLWAEGGWSAEAKEALLACFNAVAWATTGGQALVDDLEAALYPDVQLSSITAAYEQDRPIYYNISTIDDVKLDLVVTAHYSDGSDVVVDDYTLSGDLNVGTDTITVTYGGKTDTISVVVTEKWVYSISDLTKVTGTLATEDAATCKMLLSKGGSNNQYRRSFMMGRGATSVAVANSGTTITSQTSDYYPIKIPAGATKVTISITPSTQYLQVLARTLTDGVYSTLSTSSGWSGYQQSGGTKVFSAAVGDNGYIFVTSKYNSAGSSYPTEPSALDITFSDE